MKSHKSKRRLNHRRTSRLHMECLISTNHLKVLLELQAQVTKIIKWKIMRLKLMARKTKIKQILNNYIRMKV
jgi:hypothetical protein